MVLNQSGKEPPLACAGVALCLASATTGTCFSDVQFHVTPSLINDVWSPAFLEKEQPIVSHNIAKDTTADESLTHTNMFKSLMETAASSSVSTVHHLLS